MMIGSISGNGYMYNSYYSSYAMNRIPSVDASQVQKLPEKQADQQDIPVKEPQLQDIPLDNREQASKTALDPKDVSLTFNREETFDYIGADSDIAGLDMEKAISDMKKDKILQDYQYFVGTAPGSIHKENEAALPSQEDGIVIAKQ